MTTETIYELMPLIKQIASRREDFAFWQTHGTDAECYEGNDPAVIEQFKELGDFNEYGLELVFEPANQYADGHFHFLISTGDPHEELRFFPDGNIEFVSKPWGKFQCKDVTHDPVFCWVRDYFEQLECLEFDAHDGELYYWEEDDESEE